MTTKKTAATKVAPTVSPEPPDDVMVIIPDVMEAGAGGTAPAAAPAPTAGTTPGGGPQPASTITIAVGEAGFYTGARPVETLAAYDARMGASANTFADLGWILGTKPQA
jgi:hypothetical protein